MAESVLSLLQVTGYGAVPAASLALGGAVASYWVPSPPVRSVIQHIAAGFVFAAAGVEVLPDVVHRGLPLATGLGFAVGVALMLAIRFLSERIGGEGESSGGSPWTLVGVVVIDIFVDGLLVGVSYVAEQGHGRQALLVAIALSVELLSLGLSIGAAFGASGMTRARIVLLSAGVALSPLVGAVAGYALGGALTAGWLEGVLAFAVAALLYLAAEELLKEAHEVPETLAGTMAFFAAFLTLLLIDMVFMQSGG